MKSRVVFLVISTLVVLLVACGGNSAPTPMPTSIPTLAPTPMPTFIPTLAPTPMPTSIPTLAPTPMPTFIPTLAPTPLPTSTPVSLWLIAAQGYTELAEEIVFEALADVNYAHDALNEPNDCTYMHVREARQRLTNAQRKHEGFDDELRTARREMKAPAEIEEGALTLGYATMEAVLETFDSLDNRLGWTEVAVRVSREPFGCVSDDEDRMPEDLVQQLESFDKSLIEFMEIVREAQTVAN